MALIPLRPLLDHAAANNYGVVALNVNNMEQIQSIMEGARATKSPVIIQASRGARKYTNDVFLQKLMQAAVELYPEIPVVMHQDHGNAPDTCISAIRMGFTSVMMDGSLEEDGKTPASYEYNVAVTREWNPLQLLIILGMMVAVVGFIVLVERGERRIPVQYARRVVGRRVTGGMSTHLPLKVNAGGVIPVIFASSLLTFPQTAMQIQWIKDNRYLSGMLKSIAHSEPLYFILFILLIVFFCFFYVSIIFNPNEAADNMRKYGGFIPGIRPGKNTADYMNNILTKITVVGGLYLSILCLLPEIMISGIKLNHLPGALGNWIDTYFPRFLLDGLNVNFYFGGTSLLIVVGVAMDTINQIEAQLIMRHYEGFTPRAGRIRGRRSGS